MNTQIQGRDVAQEAVDAVLTHYSVLEAPIGWEDLLSPYRAPYVVKVRQVVMYVLKYRLGLSYPTIGALLERDHTTVLSGVRRVHHHFPSTEVAEVLEYVDARLDRQRRDLKAQLMQEAAS